MLFSSVLIAGFLAAGPAVPYPVSVEVRALQIKLEAAEQQIHTLQIQSARLDAITALSTAQLEAQRSMTEAALDSILLVLGIASAATTLVIGVMTFVGYRQMRGYLQAQIARQMEQAVNDVISTRVDPRIKDRLDYWDKSADILLRRIESLGAGK